MEKTLSDMVAPALYLLYMGASRLAVIWLGEVATGMTVGTAGAVGAAGYGGYRLAGHVQMKGLRPSLQGPARRWQGGQPLTPIAEMNQRIVTPEGAVRVFLVGPPAGNRVGRPASQYAFAFQGPPAAVERVQQMARMRGFSCSASGCRGMIGDDIAAAINGAVSTNQPFPEAALAQILRSW